MTKDNITEHWTAAQEGTTEERKSESKDGDEEDYEPLSNTDIESKNQSASEHTSLLSWVKSSVKSAARSIYKSEAPSTKHTHEEKTKENPEASLEEDPNQRNLRGILQTCKDDYGLEIVPSFSGQEEETKEGRMEDEDQGLALTPQPRLFEGSNGQVCGSLLVPPCQDAPNSPGALSFKASMLDSSVLVQEENNLIEAPAEANSNLEVGEREDPGTIESILHTNTRNESSNFVVSNTNTNNDDFGASCVIIGRNLGALDKMDVDNAEVKNAEDVPKKWLDTRKSKICLLAVACVCLCLVVALPLLRSFFRSEVPSAIEGNGPQNDYSFTGHPAELQSEQAAANFEDENNLEEFSETQEDATLLLRNETYPSYDNFATLLLRNETTSGPRAPQSASNVEDIPRAIYESDLSENETGAITLENIGLSGLVMLGIMIATSMCLPLGSGGVRAEGGASSIGTNTNTNTFNTKRTTNNTNTNTNNFNTKRTTIKESHARNHRPKTNFSARCPNWVYKYHNTSDILDSAVKTQVLTKKGTFAEVRRSGRFINRDPSIKCE